MANEIFMQMSLQDETFAQMSLYDIRDTENNIEPDMQSRSGLYSIPSAHSAHKELLEPIMTQAFFVQPIIGNISPTDAQRKRIHILAERILSNAQRTLLLDNMGLDSFSRDIIVLATVLVLRNWNDDDSGSNESLWKYIYNQFALPFDYRNFSGSPEYKIFREAITYTLSRHKRLEVRDGKRYYTSLLIHALAPKAKFYDLFEQIFAFYVKNLKYHYVSRDSAFSAFATAMKNRFGSTMVRRDDDVYIRSMQSSIAIRQYFLRCPVYMGNLIERIVRQMDSLVATGTVGKAESDYFDTLLIGWYEKRSREERTSDRKKQTEASTDRVVIDFRNIRLSYIYEKGKVFLVIPEIRLGKEHAEKPQITIFRFAGDEDPYVADLRWYGNYICITSFKTKIPLELFLQDNDSRCFELRAVVVYGGTVIFDSGTKLFRDILIFCDSGTEFLKRPENEYVNMFARKSCVVEGLETASDCIIQSIGDVSLYRILININTDITVNGEPLYPPELIINDLTLHLLVSPVNYCKYIESQREYSIFTRQPMLEISSKKPQFEKQYRLAINACFTQLSDFYDDSSNSYKIALPMDSGLHEFRIIDNYTHQQVYKLPYVVFKNFTLAFDGFYFKESYDNNGTLRIHLDDEATDVIYALAAEQNVMLISYADGCLAVEIPLLKCCFNGQDLTEDVGQELWHGDIPAHAVLDVDAPRGYTASIFLGSENFTESNLEIGNVIRADNTSRIKAVGIILHYKDERPVNIKLFDVVFEPYFRTTPLRIKDDALLWSAEDNFVGDKKTEFELSILHKGMHYRKYKFSCSDELINMNNELTDGLYHYTIHHKKPGFFSKYELLFSNHFIIGNSSQFEFRNCSEITCEYSAGFLSQCEKVPTRRTGDAQGGVDKAIRQKDKEDSQVISDQFLNDSAIIITEAIVDNSVLQLESNTGIVTNLRYIGCQFFAQDGKSNQYPCYKGTLLYKRNGRMKPFATKKYMRNGIVHEQVNPVKLWIVSEQVVIICVPSGKKLRVDVERESITGCNTQNKEQEVICMNQNQKIIYMKILESLLTSKELLFTTETRNRLKSMFNKNAPVDINFLNKTVIEAIEENKKLIDRKRRYFLEKEHNKAELKRLKGIYYVVKNNEQNKLYKYWEPPKEWNEIKNNKHNALYLNWEPPKNKNSKHVTPKHFHYKIIPHSEVKNV